MGYAKITKSFLYPYHGSFWWDRGLGVVYGWWVVCDCFVGGGGWEGIWESGGGVGGSGGAYSGGGGRQGGIAS